MSNVVQEVNSNTAITSTSSIQQAVSSVLAGDWLVLSLVYNSGVAVPNGISDTAGLTWTLAQDVAISGFQALALAYANFPAGGATTVTISMTHATTQYGTVLAELTGLTSSPYDQSTGASQTTVASGGTLSSGSITNTNSPCLAYGVCWGLGGAGSIVPQSGWAQVGSYACSSTVGGSITTEIQTLESATATAASYTNENGTAVARAVTLLLMMDLQPSVATPGAGGISMAGNAPTVTRVTNSLVTPLTARRAGDIILPKRELIVPAYLAAERNRRVFLPSRRV